MSSFANDGFPATTEMTNNDTSTRAAKYSHIEIDNSCLRMGQIASESIKKAGHGDERRITEFQYSETSVMNNVDEDKEAISECEMSMVDEDKSACVPFVPAAAQKCDVDMTDDNAIKFEACLNQTKVPESCLNKSKCSPPDFKQFSVDGKQKQIIIGNATTVSPKDMRVNEYDMSANSKVQQSGNQLQYD